MPTFGDGAAFAHAILPDDFKQANHKPMTEAAAKAKARVNFLMQDRLFLALYRSNDPNVRAAAMDKLNEAHHQAYSDGATKDEDAGTGWK
jgi:hypothetical protein